MEPSGKTVKPVKPELGESDLSRALTAEFPIGEIDSISLFTAGRSREVTASFALPNFGGTIFLVESQSGKFALKLFSLEQPRAQCFLEGQLLGWLKENSFSRVPQVVRTKSGAMVGTVGTRLGLLTEYVLCSKELVWSSAASTEAECGEAGGVLACLHNQLAKLPVALVSSWGLSEQVQPSTLGSNEQIGVSSIRPHIEGWLTKAFAELADGSTLMDGVTKALVFAAQPRLMELWCKSESAINACASTHTMFVHGDFHAGNLLWRSERVLAVIDFENAHYEHPLYDVAYAALMFSANWQILPGKPAFDADKAQALYSQYLLHTDHAPDAPNAPEAELRQLLPGYIGLTGVLVVLWLMNECMRTNRFDTQLRFLLANLGGFEELGSCLSSQ